MTVVGEMSLVSGRSPNLSILSVIEDALERASPYTTLLVIFAFISYQVFATFYTLFRINLGEFCFEN